LHLNARKRNGITDQRDAGPNEARDHKQAKDYDDRSEKRGLSHSQSIGVLETKPTDRCPLRPNTEPARRTFTRLERDALRHPG
jgi:hypothetical protein